MMGRIRLSDRSRGLRMPIAILARFLHYFARYVPMFPAMRVALHRLRGVRVGRGVFIGTEVFIDDAEPNLVTIEDDVTLIARVALIAHGYYPEHLQRYLAEAGGRRGITIRRGAYLGFGAIVLPGVTIGEEAIVGAGAVVTRDVPARTVVLGVPARVVKSLGEPPAADPAGPHAHAGTDPPPSAPRRE